MAAKKKSKKKVVKKLTREQELRQQLFVALAPACVTMQWTPAQASDKAFSLAIDFLADEEARER